jgi:hypothetical protein
MPLGLLLLSTRSSCDADQTRADADSVEISSASQVASDQWQVIDIEDNKVEDTLWETSRDDDFLYFKENDPNSRMNEAYRISLSGGPLQHQRDGQWYTICAKTHAVS